MLGLGKKSTRSIGPNKSFWNSWNCQCCNIEIWINKSLICSIKLADQILNLNNWANITDLIYLFSSLTALDESLHFENPNILLCNMYHQGLQLKTGILKAIYDHTGFLMRIFKKCTILSTSFWGTAVFRVKLKHLQSFWKRIVWRDNVK